MISSFVFSQEKINQTDIIKGTFQLEILKIDAEPVSITTELLLKIDSLREENKTTYLNLDTERRIKILSKKDLRLGLHKNIEDFVVVKSFETKKQ
jgi:hypothetical protein